MGKCGSCSLTRILRAYEQKQKEQALAKKIIKKADDELKDTTIQIEEQPILTVITASTPTKTKKKRASKKEVIEPVEEKTEEIIKEIKEDAVKETSSEEIIDAE